MESVMKVGRSLGGGVYRAAGAVARGARRILSAIPLLGIAPPEVYDDAENSDDKNVVEGGEEAETAEGASSPTEEKSAASPAEKGETNGETSEVGSESKPEEAKTPTKVASSSPAEEKKEEEKAAPAEVNKPEDKEKQVEAKADKKVEVSQVMRVDAKTVEVEQTLSKQKANRDAATAPSIIERKTSEDFPSQFPSSPPPTPIDPSPLQQAQQAAANATALAEALKLPAEAANNANTTIASPPNIPNYIPQYSVPPCQASPTQKPENQNSEVLFHEQTGTANPSSEESNVEISSPEIVTETPEAPVETAEPRKPEENNFVVASTEEEEESVQISSEISEPVSSRATPVVEDPVEEVVEVLPETETLVEPPIAVIESIEEIVEKDVPPPLPDSPIPVPKVTSQMMNFISTQIEDPVVIPEVVQDAEDSTQEISESEDAAIVVAETVEETSELPEDVEAVIVENIEELSEPQTNANDEVPVAGQINLVSRTIDEDETVTLCQLRQVSSESSREMEPSMENPIESVLKIPTDTTALPLTPPRSPSSGSNAEPANLGEQSTGESTSLLTDDQSNREFKMESLEQSLNSYNDSEQELKERLALSMEENEIASCQLTNDDTEENDQNKTEPEAPVENNVPNDVSPTEAKDEAPNSPPPAVPTEAPAPTGPAITEDVASVTKAIEEIDINEKAVAAAVNENIESVNTNEIIADMNHQNNMNE